MEFWFGLLLYVPVNSYGHVWTVSSPYHTIFLGILDLAFNKYLGKMLQIIYLIKVGRDKMHTIAYPA